MDAAGWIGLAIVIAGLALVRLTLFGHRASLRSDDAPVSMATVPGAVAATTSVRVQRAAKSSSSDIRVGWLTRIRSVLLLALLAAGAGAAVATLLGLVLIVLGLTLWG